MAKVHRLCAWLRRLKLWPLARILRRRRSRRAITLGAVTVGLVFIVAAVSQPAPRRIDAAAYAPLLEVIAQGESSGNYNAHFGNAANTTIRFTEMSVDEVLRWQEVYVRQGSVSSAVGRYQIVRPTLVKLIQELQLDASVRFDEKLQDRMAITLMERRGSLAYVGEELTREEFAASLAKEWAALPKAVGTDPEESYYADDGVNKSRISIPAVYDALDMLKAQ